ncbi:MAG: hypothetical protein LBV45_06385 [Xanthomonadaceae bacterium]|nr:hypothetical protein [Xanthomonadaceae bacterium]
MATAVYLLVVGILLYFYVFILFKIVIPEYINVGIRSFIIDFVFFSVLFLLPVVFAWWLGLRHDFFTYTHYPIRFNRKTRMVHAFQHNGPGGVVSVPWEQAFFFIGEGAHQKYIRDLRCHVLDGDTVKETFVVGHYFDDTQIKRIKALWEFIRRYMDEGADKVMSNPLDHYVDTSVDETWTNCYVHVAASLGPTLYSIRYLLFPVYGMLTLTRWLVFKSSKVPEWPPEIEAESVIEPDDPNRWPEPKFSGEFVNDPERDARLLERMKQFDK